MKKKILFQIPIYSKSSEEYDVYWENVIPKIIRKHRWKYNYIIGFIEVYAETTDIDFKVYIATDENFSTNNKNFNLDNNEKHFIEFHQILGNHFYAAKKSNDEIREEIREWLENIESQSPINSKFYVDYSVFDNTINYLDIKGIMNELKEE